MNFAGRKNTGVLFLYFNVKVCDVYCDYIRLKKVDCINISCEIFLEKFL